MPPMRDPLLLVALGAGLLHAAAGCTVLVVEDLVGDVSPCELAGDCAAGFSCVDGQCAALDDPGQPPPEGTRVGASGGEVLGPDGVTLSIPYGALASDTALQIARASATNVALGCDEASGFFRISPALTLPLPFDPGVVVRRLRHLRRRRRGSAWMVRQLGGAVSQRSRAAPADRCGFVAGVPVTALP